MLSTAEEVAEKLGSGFYQVRRFVEKPSVDKAKELLASGNFKWNSGMFVWKVGTVLDIMRRHAPDLAATALRLSDESRRIAIPRKWW